MTRPLRIIFSGGGTLGSVTPLIAIAARMRERHPTAQAWWCGTFRGPERRLVGQVCSRYIPLSNGKWRRYFSFHNFIDPFLIVIGFIQSFILLVLARPHVVVSAGGFVAVPLVWAAWLLRVKRIILQLDVSTSLATMLTFPFASKKVYLFAPRHPFIPDALREALVRFPVRQFLMQASRDRQALMAQAHRQFHLRPELPTVLAVGGGTGSRTLNDALLPVLPAFAEFANVIHLTGEKKTAPASPRALPAGSYFSAPFLGQELLLGYAAATLAITRGGIGTIAELSAAGIVPLVVPLPASAQEENAQYLVAQGAAIVVEQSPALGEACLHAVRKLLSDPGALNLMRQRLQDAVPVDDGTEAANVLLGNLPV